MHQPDFLIIGAPRCGTTSLYEYLQQHPQVQMSSQKEAAFHHFQGPRPEFERMAVRYGRSLLAESIERYNRARRFSVTSQDKYEQLWADDPAVVVRGEATPTYLLDPIAWQSLRESLPDSKLILVLRNPVDRAYSEYLQFLRHGFEDKSEFDAAVASEPVDVPDYWWGARRYIRSGFYSNHIARYLSTWPSDKVCVFLYDDLAHRTSGVVSDCFEFLGVDPTFPVDTQIRHKTAYIPSATLSVSIARSQGPVKRLSRLVVSKSLRRHFYERWMQRPPVAPPVLEASTRAQLNEVFRPFTLELQELLSRDLGNWLKE